jgi:hypothetical protein
VIPWLSIPPSKDYISKSFENLTKQNIELPRPCSNPANLLALLKNRHPSLETHGLNLSSSLIDLLSLLLGDTLDVKHLFLGT